MAEFSEGQHHRADHRHGDTDIEQHGGRQFERADQRQGEIAKGTGEQRRIEQ